MHILLQKVIPSYFEKDSIVNSDIWGKNIAFNKGEHIQIVAPSGSGKTSLIHFLYGLRKDYEGNISFQNEEIKKVDLDNFSLLRQKNISIVFQDLKLFPKQTARQNIEIKRQLNSYHPSAKIDEMAAELSIQNKLNKVAETCSYGEQQRIAIIRSLMQPFDFLLLDEPFSHLDELNRNKAIQLIMQETTSRNASVIFCDLKKLDFFENKIVLHL